MKLIAGSASQALGRGLARELSIEQVQVESKRFPDTEFYARILTAVTGEEVVIVQNTFPDHNLVELFLLQDAARRAGASRIITVVPYFSYARQDKQFLQGEPVSADALSKVIELNSDVTVTVDIHDIRTLAAFSKPVRNASAMPAIGKFLRGRVDAILSPDKGSRERVKAAADAAGVPCDHLEKKRLDGSTVQITPKELGVFGKRVAIVDDIIATGGTMIKAAEQLRAQGASKVIAACTHGLFTGGAIERLRGAFDGLHACDTLETPSSDVSAAEPIASILKEIRA